jgi:hypothetical protein
LQILQRFKPLERTEFESFFSLFYQHNEWIKEKKWKAPKLSHIYQRRLGRHYECGPCQGIMDQHLSYKEVHDCSSRTSKAEHSRLNAQTYHDSVANANNHRWLIGDNDLTEELLTFRKKSVAYANDKKDMTGIWLMNLSHIYYFPSTNISQSLTASLTSSLSKSAKRFFTTNGWKKWKVS